MSDPLPTRRARLAARDRRELSKPPVTRSEAVIVIAVIAAVLAMVVWFFCFSSGGIGPGTV